GRPAPRRVAVGRGPPPAVATAPATDWPTGSPTAPARARRSIHRAGVVLPAPPRPAAPPPPPPATAIHAVGARADPRPAPPPHRQSPLRPPDRQDPPWGPSRPR